VNGGETELNTEFMFTAVTATATVKMTEGAFKAIVAGSGAVQWQGVSAWSMMIAVFGVGFANYRRQFWMQLAAVPFVHRIYIVSWA
jgi:hypothetical protein